MLDYKLPLQEQVDTISKVTEGNFHRAFDASAQSSQTAFDALHKVSRRNTGEKKLFATTDDWYVLLSSLNCNRFNIMPIRTEMTLPSGIDTYRVHLGQMGRAGSGNDVADEVKREVTKFIPKLERLFASGDLKAMKYTVANDSKVGFEGVITGIKMMNKGSEKGKKIVVRLQNV